MRHQRALRHPGALAIVLCLLNISGTAGTASEPLAATHTFIIDFDLDKSSAPKVLRPGLMARDLSKKLDELSTGSIKFTARDPDEEDPCGKDANCDVVTVKETADESERGGIAIVLTVTQAKVPKRHKTREYPLDEESHSCEFPPATRQSWNRCVDGYSKDMLAELRGHVRDDHPATVPN
jgi:hypothetical protein